MSSVGKAVTIYDKHLRVGSGTMGPSIQAWSYKASQLAKFSTRSEYK